MVKGSMKLMQEKYGLSKDIFVKVMHCKFSKEVWEKLNSIYHRNDRLNQANIKTLRGNFEELKMIEEEKVAGYLLRIDEIVNVIHGLGEEIEDKIVVNKVIRSFPTIFDSKISVIVESKDIDKYPMDDLHGELTTYEMRTCKEESSSREETFKVDKKRKTTSNSKDFEVIESHLVRKLTKGSRKYKGKLPFSTLR